MMLLVAALLLGLRHATDPDHLAAISTLVLAEGRARTRHVGLLGLSWGAGHAVTVLAVGVPLVLVRRSLPPSLQLWAEVAVGLVIVLLALRLLVRCRAEGAVRPPLLGRSLLGSFGVGLLHGVGGSAGITLVVLAAVRDPAAATLALALFAGGAALSMAGATLGLGWIASRERLAGLLPRLVPVAAGGALLFGVWYALAALPRA